MKNINISFEDADFERLEKCKNKIREKMNLTELSWRSSIIVAFETACELIEGEAKK